MNLRRLKIKLCDELQAQCAVEMNHFWLLVDCEQLTDIEKLRTEVLSRVLALGESSDKNDRQGRRASTAKRKRKPSELKQIQLFIEDYQLPSSESTSSLLRDSDIVVVQLETGWSLKNQQTKKKRKINITITDNKENANLEANSFNNEEDLDSEIKPPPPPPPPKPKPFQAVLIGTSMIKHIRPAEIFKEKKCFFKAMSGARIEQILHYLQARRGDMFAHCSVFCVVCGSNDCDSPNALSATLSSYLSLVSHLAESYPRARLLLNTLVARQSTRFTTAPEFEQRRVAFNRFLSLSVSGLFANARVVTHESCEQQLSDDGVHLSLAHGLPLYVEEISRVISEEADAPSECS